MCPSVHIVPHTHWDREWYYPAARFQLRLARVVEAALGLLERQRLPSFLLDGQGIVLDDYRLVRPDARARLTKHLASGRLECGPWYVLADNLLVSGEALVRNLQEGGRAVGRYGGKSMRVGYAPDTFGHPAILPTLFVGFGIHNAVTWRGFGGERGQEKDLYRWLGPDGSEAVMIHLPPQGYENAANLTGGRVGEWASVLERRSRSPHWLLLNGADHHAPQPDLRDTVRELAKLAPAWEFRIGRLGDYAAQVEKWARAHTDELPVLLGELRQGRRAQWVLQGTHSARLYLKQRNARCQRLLERAAEPLCALAGSRIPHSPFPIPVLRDELRAAWRTLLENHPHDSICGTSADAVHREMMTRFDRCAEMGDEIVQRALDTAIGHDPDAARVAGRSAWKPALLLFNPSPRPRSGVVVAEVALFMADVRVGQQRGTQDRPVGAPLAGAQVRRPGELILRDRAAKAVPFQELARRDGYDLVESPRYYPDCDAVEWRTVAIAVQDLPPLGIRALNVEEATVSRQPSAVSRPVRISERGLENEHVRIRVEADGTLALGDRATGRSAHGLGAIECRSDQGDSYTSSPRGPNLTRVPDAVAVRVVHAGPLVGQLEVIRHFVGAPLVGALSVTTTITLSAGARHVELEVEFDNADPARRVRAAFPLGAKLQRVVADGPFGPVERSPRPVRKRPGDLEAPDPCAPMQRYVSVAGAQDALTVFSDGLPQYEARPDGTALITLLRSMTQLSKPDLPERPGNAGWPTPTPEGACLGPAPARLAVMLHGPGALDERDEIEEVAEAFLAPPRGFMRRALLAMPSEVRGPELRGEGLVFSAMKPAESGKGMVVRCYNARRGVGRGAWGVGKTVKSATLCRLDEKPIRKLEIRRGEVRFEAAPREIVTILARFEPDDKRRGRGG